MLQIPEQRLAPREKRGPLLGAEPESLFERGGLMVNEVVHGESPHSRSAAIASAPAAIALTMLW
jgi:hypothetical protein